MEGYDISRVTFDPKKHYAGVRMQQGRVLTDDDWNENERIENEERRRSRVEIIGPFGSPDDGFKIDNLRVEASGEINFDILPGTVHLGGLRLEMESAQEGPPPTPETYLTQRDWLQQPSPSEAPPALTLGETQFNLVYLEAWQQAVSAVEDTELLEPALGGPDTTTRTRSMRRIKIFQNPPGLEDCAKAFQQLKQIWETANRGAINAQHELVPNASLTVSYLGTGTPQNLCSPSSVGGYLGAENQAIRVQLIDSGHFTWGFDNASPLYRVQVNAAGDTVTFITEPKDQHHWPLSGQIVEILPWLAVLPNGEKVAEQQGHLSKVDASYNPDTQELTLLSPITDADFGVDWQSRNNGTQPDYFYLRVWQRGDDLSSDAAMPFTPGTAVSLGTTGLQVTFNGNDLNANDYWVIAARPETPEQVLPWILEQGKGPDGVRRFYAPLAVLQWTADASGNVTGQVIHDCRKKFRPLTDQDCCCTFTVGDGVHSKGDFDSIEEALRNLPEEGGKICVLPGEHLANVVIDGRRQITISGCGERSIVKPHPDRTGESIFRIISSNKIKIEQLSLIAFNSTAISVRDDETRNDSSHEITIHDNRIMACIHGIEVMLRDDLAGDNDIRITYNHIGMIDKDNGLAAIFCRADGVLIERNRLVVVPPPDPNDPNDPRNEDDPSGGVFDPCADHKLFYVPTFKLNLYLFKFFAFVKWVFLLPTRKVYRTLGGIQIGGGSERVRILENEIIGGRGNGITLGHLPTVPDEIRQPPVVEDVALNRYEYLSAQPTKTHFATNEIKAFVAERFRSALYEISIENNKIQHFGLSGIGVVAWLDIKTIGMAVNVEDLTVYRNHIQLCAQQLPTEIPASMIDDVGFGGIGLSYCRNATIGENLIENNGISLIEPVCGIFILYGEKIDISDNHILNNGPRTSFTEQQDPRRGERGGIVIKMSYKDVLAEFTGEGPVGLYDGIPAVKVHDNIVAQPLGHALLLMAFGPVSVVGNQFTTQATNRQHPLSLLAGAVFILNLGVSKDFLFTGLLKNFKGISKVGTNYASAKNTAFNADILTRLQLLPSGSVMFSDNQVTLELRGGEVSFSLSAQLLASLDDIAYLSNQSECAGLIAQQTIDLVLINTILFGYTVRSNDNRFQEGFTLALYSLLSFGVMNTALGNQSTHCLLVLGSRRPPATLLDQSNLVLRNDRCRDGTNAFRLKYEPTTNLQLLG